MQRRESKQIHVGNVPIGGGAPVVVQSMTTTDTADVAGTLAQIHRLVDRGCEIVRVAVPDKDAAAALPEITKKSPVPIIADIHFDYRLALAALEGGVHGLRLNPGNIRKREQVEAVVKAAKERQVPIRVGVNGGSLPPTEGTYLITVQRMVDAALWEIGILEELGFDQIKVSLKAFDVPTMIAAYQTIADKIPYPLHLGVTEAGTPKSGSIRSAVGIGTLLALGIGDTIRVSLAADPVEEVDVAYEILKSLNLRQRGPTMIACPTCGRLEIELIPLANKVEEYLKTVNKPIKVAVMGCVVNGPGEAQEADIGIAGGKGRAAIFRYGKVVRTVDEDELWDALKAEIDAWRPEDRPAHLQPKPGVIPLTPVR